MTVRDLGKAIGGAILERLGRASSRFQEEAPIPVDVLESDEEYLVVFDAPGVTSSDVQVSYRGRTVIVRIDRFREFHEGYEMRFPGRGLQLDGSAELPEDAVVDASHARAELRDNGTLYVFLPKAEAESEAETEATGTETAVETETGAEEAEPQEATEAEVEDEPEDEVGEGVAEEVTEEADSEQSADDGSSAEKDT